MAVLHVMAMQGAQNKAALVEMVLFRSATSMTRFWVSHHGGTKETHIISPSTKSSAHRHTYTSVHVVSKVMLLCLITYMVQQNHRRCHTCAPINGRKQGSLCC